MKININNINREMKIKIILTITASILLAVIVVALNQGVDDLFWGRRLEFERLRVIEVVDERLVLDTHMNSGLYLGPQDLRVEILTGPHRGRSVDVPHSLSLYYNVHARAGMTLVGAVIYSYDGTYDYYGEYNHDGTISIDMINYHRAPYIFWFVLLFVLMLLIIGRKKGLKALLGLAFTMFCIFYIFLPMLYRGVPAILAAVIIGIISTVVALALLNGISRKTLAAIIGTTFGVVIAGLVAWGFGTLARVTIFNTDFAEALVAVAQDTPIRINGLLFSGVIIAALGAVMDVGVSISSAVFELQAVSKKPDMKQLFSSGMNIGRDVMGTMSNTLILAFMGASLNVVVLLYAYQLPVTQLMNLDMMTLEVLQAISGTIGIIFTVPITAFVSSYLCTKIN